MQTVSGRSVGQEEEVVEMVEETVDKSRRQEELISFIFFDKQDTNHPEEWMCCKCNIKLLLSRIRAVAD